MGLADRDYYREPPSRSSMRSPLDRGRSSLAMWSINTWLIILCVGVFVLDGFLPVVDVPTGRMMWRTPAAAQLDPALVEGGSLVPGPGVHPWRTLHEKGNPEVLGWQEVMRMHVISKYLHFSTRLAGFEFWRFLGFQFLHANLAHLVFNMIGLYFFGPIVEDYLGRKRYLAFYLLCGCCGALLYLILNGIGYAVAQRFGSVAIPGLLFSDPATPLVGASAGIFGVIMAGAFLVPNAVALALFIIPIRLQTLAYLLVGLAFFTLITGGNNAGGEAGHLGGAIAGFYFIRRPHHLHNFFDILGRADPTSHHYRTDGKSRKINRSTGERSPFRTRGGSGGSGGSASGAGGGGRHVGGGEVDRILAKINREGLSSLSDEEKRILARASKR